jgi:hypothetical protein
MAKEKKKTRDYIVPAASLRKNSAFGTFFRYVQIFWHKHSACVKLVCVSTVIGRNVLYGEVHFAFYDEFSSNKSHENTITELLPCTL